MKDYHYILDENRTPVAIKIWENGQINRENLEIWARIFENFDNRKVAYDKVGDIIISTVFLGIDHSISYDIESPVLFETSIIKGDDFEIVDRHLERIAEKLRLLEDHG